MSVKKIPYAIKMFNNKQFDLDSVDLSYIAGLIDSDGSIFISRIGRSKNFVKLRAGVAITGTNRTVFDWLVNKIPYHSLHKNKNNCYIFEVYHVGAVHCLLKSINDKLVLKRKVAELVLRFLMKKRRYYRSHGIDVHKKLRDLYNMAKKLNKTHYGFSLEESGKYTEKLLYPYLAGVIDGDGTVYDNGKRRLSISIATVVEDYASWLQQQIEGSCIYKNTSVKAGNIYVVILKCEVAVLKFLELIRPYATIKKGKIEGILKGYTL